MDKNRFIKRLQEQVAAIDEILGAFSASLSPEKMFHDLKWADSVFEQSARRHVFVSVLREIQNADKGVTQPRDIPSWVMQKVVESARDRSKSTSTCTNLLSRCETEAWAAVADIMGMCP